jgi:C1A family cysteine protease
MKTIAVIAFIAVLGGILLSTQMQDSNDVAFGQYMSQYTKSYATQEEYEFRREIFSKNMKKIEEHNAKKLSYWFGVNEFTDWTDEEYQMMLGLKGKTNLNAGLPTAQLKRYTYEEDHDWRNYPGFVGKVLNQGKCGSCWAFSAAQTLAGAYFKAYGKEVEVAPSHAVDCDWFSHGCNGGLQENAFVHWMRHRAILEEDYPYEAKDRDCKEDSVDEEKKLPPVLTAFRVDVGPEFLYDALKHQPVSISIRAENDDFRHYQGGIIDGDGCGWEIDHAVLLVGYNKADDAWIVKNSWGDQWGENGYVRIKRRDGKGICGINQQNSIPLFKDDDFE